MAQHPYMAVLEYDSGGSVYLAALNLYSLKDSDYTVGIGNKTHLSSTNARKRKMAGWIDLSPVTATGEYISATYALLLGFLRTTKTWRIQFEDGSTATNGSTFVFTGFITKLGTNEFNRDQDDPIETSIEIQPDGDTMTFTPAA